MEIDHENAAAEPLNEPLNEQQNQPQHAQDNTKAAIEYSQFSTRYESETSAIWCWLHPSPRPCLNTTIINELEQFQQQLSRTYKSRQTTGTSWPFRHLIIASKTPGIYNLGGDLALFEQCIRQKDEEKLRDYAYQCIKLLHRNIDHLDLPITTVSLIQGQALGGGFEMALSSDIIVAERRSQLGFPEILFNLFPGMGAYNLLTRRIGSALAERIILSGRTYNASELYDMGVIDVIAEDGDGIAAVEEYLKSHNQSHNTIRSIKKIRQIVHPITLENLYDIVDIWVEAAMALSEKDLAKMTRLLHLQKDMKSSDTIHSQHQTLTPRRGDWRKISNVSFPLMTHLGEYVFRNRRKKESRRQK